MPHHPGLLQHGLSPGKHDEIGNTPNLKPRRKLRVRLRIHLQHQRLAGHVGRGAGHLRRGLPAGSAPTRPEVHQYRHGALRDDLVEQHCVHCQRFGKRRQRCFARSAPSCLAQVGGGHAVFLLAVGAVANHGHGIFSSRTCFFHFDAARRPPDSTRVRTRQRRGENRIG